LGLTEAVVVSDLPAHREVSAMSGGGFTLAAHDAPTKVARRYLGYYTRYVPQR
jgi:hypothetical protein